MRGGSASTEGGESKERNERDEREERNERDERDKRDEGDPMNGGDTGIKRTIENGKDKLGDSENRELSQEY